MYGILYFCTFLVLVYLFVTTRRKEKEEPSFKSSRLEPTSWKITHYNWWPEWRSTHRAPPIVRPVPTVHYTRPWGGGSRYANGGAH